MLLQTDENIQLTLNYRKLFLVHILSPAGLFRLCERLLLSGFLATSQEKYVDERAVFRKFMVSAHTLSCAASSQCVHKVYAVDARQVLAVYRQPFVARASLRRPLVAVTGRTRRFAAAQALAQALMAWRLKLFCVQAVLHLPGRYTAAQQAQSARAQKLAQHAAEAAG